MKKMVLTMLGMATAVCNCCFADIHIDGYTNATNDRFTSSGSFILNRYSLSGVGQSETGSWGTLVSPNVIISAAHAAPQEGSMMTFYLNNDASAEPVVRKVTSVISQIGKTDLSVGVLNAPVYGATYYDIADEVLTGPPGGVNNLVAAGSFQGVSAYLFGRSPYPHDPWHDQAVGRNLISGYWENYGRLTDQDTLFLDYHSGSKPGVVRYEAYFQAGDSGAPMFIVKNGKLLLLGTNSLVVMNGSGQVISSGVAYVGNQADFIRKFANAEAVPEPTLGWLLGGMAGVTLALFRGRTV